MKKIMIATLAMVVLLTSSIGVFAEELPKNEKNVSNMDAETFLELRMERIEQALEDGKITEDQAELLIAHVEEVAEAGDFGTGRFRLEQGEGNTECVLGEGNELGLFRNEMSGKRNGDGNGVRLQKEDGSGVQSGGRGNGRKISRNEECVLD